MKNEYMNSKNRKEFVYKFADGETVVLTADERNMSADAHHVSMEWINVLRNEERKIYNNEHAETRRHCSMEAMNPDFPSSRTGLEEDMDTLWESLASCLTPRQAEIGRMFFVDGKDEAYIAEVTLVTVGRVSQIIRIVREKIKKSI